MRVRKLVLLLLLCIPLSLPVWGQSSATQDSAQAVSNASSAPKIVEYTLPPDKLQKAHALYIQSTRLLVVDTVYGFLVLLGLLYFGTVAGFRNLAESITQRKWLQGLIDIPLFVVISSMLTIPSDIYHHHLSLAYGLSIQSWSSWWGDWIKNLLVTAVIGTVLLSLLYLMIRRSPKRWWFYGWLICIPVVVFVLFIGPVVIEPLFNKFSPLDQTHPELVGSIEQVVKRGGMAIPHSRMYLMDA